MDGVTPCVRRDIQVSSGIVICRTHPKLMHHTHTHARHRERPTQSYHASNSHFAQPMYWKHSLKA